MGYRFILEAEDCRDFYETERQIIERHRWKPEPPIEIKLDGNNRIIIEPLDQRRTGRYPTYIKELVGRASERFNCFTFKKEEGFNPNPPLDPIFFKQRILYGALERYESSYGSNPSLEKLISELVHGRVPALSDEFLKKMVEEGLRIKYSKRLKVGAGYCSGSGLEVLVGVGGSQNNIDETLVHEIIEAYLKRVGITSLWGWMPRMPHKYIDMLTEELLEFGFAQTIKRLVPSEHIG